MVPGTGQHLSESLRLAQPGLAQLRIPVPGLHVLQVTYRGELLVDGADLLALEQERGPGEGELDRGQRLRRRCPQLRVTGPGEGAGHDAPQDRQSTRPNTNHVATS